MEISWKLFQRDYKVKEADTLFCDKLHLRSMLGEPVPPTSSSVVTGVVVTSTGVAVYGEDNTRSAKISVLVTDG